MRREWARRVLLAVCVLAPVFWQSRLQAGDLSSHVYNAWLAHLAESGRADGLTVVPQSSNVLFDLLLAALFRLGGSSFAQHASVALAVLIFVSGALRFIGSVSGRDARPLLPVISILAYGWVFHMGFFNFYLSMGLTLWAFALACSGTRAGAAMAIILAVPAYVAHALPVAWGGGLLAYRMFAAKLSPKGRMASTAAAVLLIACAHIAIARVTAVRWSPDQISAAFGADQSLVFDGKYLLVLLGVWMVWTLGFAILVRDRGVREVAGSMALQLCVLSAATVSILPTAIQLPGYHHSLTYIAERMSLGAGVCVCALMASAPSRRLWLHSAAAVALLFFVFLYRDERSLNALEDRLDAAVAQLPQGTRVVSEVADSSLRTFVVTHMIDRVCTGRCFSYANYEPSTLAFRVRTVRENGIVISSYGDSWKMQNGIYVVKESDPPLMQIYRDEQGQVGVRSLKPGSLCGIKPVKVLPDLFRKG